MTVHDGFMFQLGREAAKFALACGLIVMIVIVGLIVVEVQIVIARVRRNKGCPRCGHAAHDGKFECPYHDSEGPCFCRGSR